MEFDRPQARLTVLAAEPGAGWFAEVRVLSAALDADRVVLALPRGENRIVGTPDEILEAWSECGAAILTAAETSAEFSDMTMRCPIMNAPGW